MHSSFPASAGNFSFLYFCQFHPEGNSIENLADFLCEFSNSEKFLLGFDREMWSTLSSGQMPSQLFSLNFYGSPYKCEVLNSVIVLFSTEEICDFPDSLSVYCMDLGNIKFESGEIVEGFEEDEEFQNCYYGTCLIWDNFESAFPEVGQVRNFWFGKNVQLLIGKNIYSQDDWVETYFNNSNFNDIDKVAKAAHLLFPNSEKISSLKETILDKEKIHLEDDIKGIFC